MKNGLTYCLRYSYITNKLDFCGPRTNKLLYDAIIGKKVDKVKIREIITRFEGLYPYLKFIGEKNKKDFLDYDVVEAYWIGNELLNKFNVDDLKKMIIKLAERGLPKSIADKLVKRIPKGCVPHHSFNVLFVGVGAVTGSVATNIENMDNCMISWGKVKEVLKKKLVVEYSPLVFEKEKFVFGGKKEKKVDYLKEFLPKVKANDFISMHWNFAVEVLDKRKLNNLKKYTLMNIEAINKHI
jgi:hypothetical protein